MLIELTVDVDVRQLQVTGSLRAAPADTNLLLYILYNIN